MLVPAAAEQGFDQSLDGLVRQRVITFQESKLLRGGGSAPRALMLALDQLLDNACQHANRSMSIQLSLAESDGLDHCIMEFASQSLDAAVASKDLERWSAPFFRGEHERDGERVEGPGLGLALARELVRGCGGTLELHQQPSSVISALIS